MQILMTNMPLLSRHTHCTLCASPEHKAPDCPRRELSAKDASAKPKSDAAIARAAAKRAAAIAKSDAAKAIAAAKRAARSAAKRAAAIAKSDAAKAIAAAKRAAAIAKSDAAKARAAAKREAQRAALIAQRERVAQVQAMHTAAYAALVGVGVPILTTPGNYRHSTWAVVNNLCDTCNFPPGRCMCIKR